MPDCYDHRPLGKANGPARRRAAIVVTSQRFCPKPPQRRSFLAFADEHLSPQERQG